MPSVAPSRAMPPEPASARGCASWRAPLARAHRRLSGVDVHEFAQRAVLARLVRAQARERRYLSSRPDHLRHHEQRIHSQNGEDGLIAEAFRRLGVATGVFVEFGCGNGSENCTRNLLEQGWSGVWIEGDPEAVAVAVEVTAGRPLRVVEEFLTVDRIRQVFRDAGVPSAPDLLVVDVDGNDWWLARELLRSHLPRAILVEVNASMGTTGWVMPYDQGHRWDGSRWYGASLRSWHRLLRQHGYVLAACESTGVNALFVRRSDSAALRLPAGGASVRREFVAPKQHAASYGHPVAPAHPRSADRLLLDQLALVRLEQPRLHSPVPMQPGQPVFGSVVVDNRTHVTLTGGGQTPVRLAVRWLHVASEAPASMGEPERSEIAAEIPPGKRRWCPIRTSAPELPGTYLPVVTLVQEHVAWLDDVGTPAPLPTVLVRRQRT